MGCSNVAFAGAYGEFGVNGHGALNDSCCYGPKFVVLDTSGHPADFTIAQQHRIAVNWETVVAAIDMQEHESTRWLAKIVYARDRLLTAVAALGQMH